MAEANLAVERGAHTAQMAETVAVRKELATERAALAALQVAFAAELLRARAGFHTARDTTGDSSSLLHQISY